MAIDSLAGVADLTHVNLNDGVCEGLAARDANAFSVQHHPEAGPGPHDSGYLFDRFAARMAAYRGGRIPQLFADDGHGRGRLGQQLTGDDIEPVGLPEPAAGVGLMPRRDDISSILVIGSGPIVIGQACEFDYSGTQACRVLREEGYRVILANSNPATIMTDPDFADRTYVEPLTPEVVARIIERERPDAVLPTLGGQTGAEHRHGPVRAWA